MRSKRLRAENKIAMVRFEMYGFDMYNRDNLLRTPRTIEMSKHQELLQEFRHIC